MKIIWPPEMYAAHPVRPLGNGYLLSVGPTEQIFWRPLKYDWDSKQWVPIKTEGKE